MMNMEGLILLSLALGLGHGIDWDHIATITDIVAGEKKKKGLILAVWYAVGHELVILCLGVAAVLFGLTLPNWVDGVMEKFVGITLVVLALYLIYSLIRNNHEMAMVSRWRLIYTGIKNLIAWIGEKMFKGFRGFDSSLNINMTRKGSAAIGIIHGIGAATPTQLLLFVTASGAGSPGQGLMAVFAFAGGLLVSHIFLSIISVVGFSKILQNQTVFRGVAVITSVFSLVLGGLFILGETSIIPEIF